MKRLIAAFLLSTSLAFGVVQPIAHSQQQVMRRPITSGSSAPAFPTISTTWAWYEPARETGYSDGDGISPLTDQSGNSRNWTNTGTTASHPQFQINQLNSLAVANGNHASNSGWDTGPNMSGLTAVHAFMVVLAAADPAGDLAQTGLWNVGNDANSEHIPYVNGLLYSDAFSTTRHDGMGHTLNLASTYRLLEWVSTSSEWTLKINGTETVLTTGTNTVGCPSSPTLLTASGASSRHKLAFLYISSAKLGSTDRTAIIDYINNRFGTTFAVDVRHPLLPNVFAFLYRPSMRFGAMRFFKLAA